MNFIPSPFSRQDPSGKISDLNLIFPIQDNCSFKELKQFNQMVVLICNVGESNLYLKQGPCLLTGEFVLFHSNESPQNSKENGDLYLREISVLNSPLNRNSRFNGLVFTLSPEFFNEMLEFMGIGLNFSDLFDLRPLLMESDLLGLIIDIKATIQKWGQGTFRDNSLWMAEMEDYFMELFQSLLSILKMKQKSLDQLDNKKNQTREDLIQSILRSRNFIEINFSQEINNETIANAAGLSLYHFQRIFKKLFGQTPGQYVTRYRLERARKMILYDKKSITDTSFDVGYESLSSFIHAFKAYFGISPKKLNKQNL